MKIGVFDSGIGGLSVVHAIKAALPDYKVVFRNDPEHMPYGSRKPQDLLELVVPIFQKMIDEDCRVIVVACNTVSTTIITELRNHFPDTPLVAIEPMVKPAAALTKTNVIAVCATPTTLGSQRYNALKSEFAVGKQVLEPDCSDWSAMIEHNDVDEQKIQDRIDEALDDGADVIVLACTHYHWIESMIMKMARGRAKVIQPEAAIIQQLKRVLEPLT